MNMLRAKLYQIEEDKKQAEADRQYSEKGDIGWGNQILSLIHIYAVKLEGGAAQAEKIRAIVDAGIPVVGHIGLLPQKVLEEGGYKTVSYTHIDVYKRQPRGGMKVFGL